MTVFCLIILLKRMIPAALNKVTLPVPNSSFNFFRSGFSRVFDNTSFISLFCNFHLISPHLNTAYPSLFICLCL